MRGRLGAVMIACAALAAGACQEAEAVPVQELPPLQRPSPEARAGLPEVRGVWRFTGFEIPARDTMLVREQVYALTPPGDLQVATQRLDSIAGSYARGGASFPFVGEVRRDSIVSLVAFAEGVGQFAAGRIVRDTLWLELTSFPSAVQTWPRGTRAALVRKPAGAPFRRLLGGAPIEAPVDSARLDSLRLDSLRRAGVLPPAGQTVPATPGTVTPGTVVPPVTTPQARPVTPAPQNRPVTPAPQNRPVTPAPQNRPVTPAPQNRPVTPAPQRPRPTTPTPTRPPVQRPPVEQAPPPQEQPPEPEPETITPLPRPNAPRDTIRFGSP